MGDSQGSGNVIQQPHCMMGAMMTSPLPVDLRHRIAAALGDGATVRQAAKRFGVSVSSTVRVGQRRKSGPGQGHGKIGGHRRPKLKGETGTGCWRVWPRNPT